MRFPSACVSALLSSGYTGTSSPFLPPKPPAAAFATASSSAAAFRLHVRPSSSSVPSPLAPTVTVAMSTNADANAADAAASAAAASTTTCPAAPSRSLNLFSRTPLLLSAPLTELLSATNPKAGPVYLKLDSLQGSGSFKDRGMAHLCHTLRSGGCTKLISSSGGNAGLAVATVAPRLGMSVSVIVPKTTKAMVVEKLRGLGAEVTVHGANWNEADLLARELAERDGGAEYVSPYDHPLLWTGHSTVVDEIAEQLADYDLGEEGGKESSGRQQRIGTIVASVGGGGLICGILEGLSRRGLTGTALIAAETEGAASFGKAFDKAGSTEPIRLEAINSVATSLGALEVTPVALERARAHQSNGGMVEPALCTDAEAVEACVRFAEDHRVLVEPACGAALAVLYLDRLREDIFGGGRDDGGDLPDGPVVVEVCGGSGVNLELLGMWKEQFLSG